MESMMWGDNDFPSLNAFCYEPKREWIVGLEAIFTHVRHTCKNRYKQAESNVCTLTVHLSSSEPIFSRKSIPNWSPSSLPPLSWQTKAYSTLFPLKPCINCTLAFNTPSTFYKVAHCHAVVTSCLSTITKLCFLNYRPKVPKDRGQNKRALMNIINK